MRENAGSGRDGGGERESMCACETKRGAERQGERGEGEVRVRVFSVVIILIT